MKKRSVRAIRLFCEALVVCVAYFANGVIALRAWALPSHLPSGQVFCGGTRTPLPPRTTRVQVNLVPKPPCCSASTLTRGPSFRCSLATINELSSHWETLIVRCHFFYSSLRVTAVMRCARYSILSRRTSQKESHHHFMAP